MNEQLKELTEKVNGSDEKDGEMDEELTGYCLQIDKLTELIHQKTSDMEAQLKSLGVGVDNGTDDQVGADEKDSEVGEDAKSQSDVGQIEDMLGINTTVETERRDPPSPSDVDQIDQLLNIPRLHGVDNGSQQTPGYVGNTGMAAGQVKPFLKANTGIARNTFEDVLEAEWSRIVPDRPSKGKAKLEPTVNAAQLAAQIKMDVEKELSDMLQLPKYNQAYGFEDAAKAEQMPEDTVKAGNSRIVQDHPSGEYSGGEDDDPDAHTPAGSEDGGPYQSDYTERTQLREDVKNACSSWDILKTAGDAGPSEIIHTSCPTSGVQATDASESEQEPQDIQDDEANLPADRKHPVPGATVGEESETRQVPQDVQKAISENSANAELPQPDKAKEAGAASDDDGWTVVGPKRTRKNITQSENIPAQIPQDAGASEPADTEHPELSQDGSSTAGDSVASSCTVQDAGLDQPDAEPPKPTYDDISTVSESESISQLTPESNANRAPSTTGVATPSEAAPKCGFPLELLSSEPLPLTLRRYSEGAYPDYLRVLLGSEE